jgi:hypothetical protein
MNAQNAPWGGIAVVECAPLNTKQSERDHFLARQLTLFLLFDFAAFVRVALLRVLAVLDDFSILPRFFLDFLHLSALVLEPNLRTKKGKSSFQLKMSISLNISKDFNILSC